MIQLTQDNIVTVVLVCLIVFFFGAEKILKAAFELVLEPIQSSSTTTTGQLCKLSRVSAAALIMRFVSILLKVVSGIALALGLFKAFGALASLTLPDRTLGFSVLLGYCGLASVFGVLAEDLREGLKKLLK
jgi:hypothetical protein